MICKICGKEKDLVTDVCSGCYIRESMEKVSAPYRHDEGLKKRAIEACKKILLKLKGGTK